MFNQYFGNYLLNRSIISNESLKEALQVSDSTRVKLGVLAINAGLLTAAQVNEIQGLQKTMDKRIGEIAVLKGYLTANQVDELLGQQKNSYTQLSQTLVDMNLMTMEQLEKALNDYKRDSGLTLEQFTAIQQGDMETVVRSFLTSTDSGYTRTLQDYVLLMMNSIVRFLGQVPILKQPPVATIESNIAARQDIVGPFTMASYVAMDKQTFVKVAQQYSGIAIDSISELAESSVAEFLNLNNGLFIINMDNQGINMHLEPPVIIPNYSVKSIAIPCQTDLGVINVILEKIN
ncbi:MAG: hypothetical protein ACM3MK_11455 [Chitinophagales bacterium]